jgi:hypothetical protein
VAGGLAFYGPAMGPAWVSYCLQGIDGILVRDRVKSDDEDTVMDVVQRIENELNKNEFFQFDTADATVTVRSSAVAVFSVSETEPRADGRIL